MAARYRSARRQLPSRFETKTIRRQADVVAALAALPYLDTEQAAFIAQTSPSTIRRACSEGGHLAHVRLGGGKLIRITPDDLRKWLTAGTTVSHGH
jgi:hypothetical protein